MAAEQFSSPEMSITQRRREGSTAEHGAHAKILGTDEYAEFIPGKDAAPVFKYSQPSGNGGFRTIWALLWDVPETSIESENGTRMASLSDIEEHLQEKPQALEEISSVLGVGAYSDEAKCFPNLEPICYEGDFVGFGCLAPNGFNQISWFPNRFKCPVVSCLAPGKLSSVDCYVWDMPAQNLVDDEG